MGICVTASKVYEIVESNPITKSRGWVKNKMQLMRANKSVWVRMYPDAPLLHGYQFMDGHIEFDAITDQHDNRHELETDD